MELAVLDPIPEPVRRARRPLREAPVEVSVEVRHVVFFLNDAVPDELIVRMEHAPEEVTLAEALLHLLKFDGDCALGHLWNAKSVEDAIRAGEGRGYRLVALRVLPNHVHVLVEATPAWPMGDPIHRWKLASSPRRIGAPRPGLARFGPDRLRPRALRHDLPRPDEFWADEDFERILRSQTEVDEALRLIAGISPPAPRPPTPPPEDVPQEEVEEEPPEPAGPTPRREPKWVSRIKDATVPGDIYAASVFLLFVILIVVGALTDSHVTH
ncbi:MAG TPA: hypothetical protein VGH03_15040 [Caulobacteraceae bacterium]|jgi:REP element-mobilizing transposase RayT